LFWTWFLVVNELKLRLISDMVFGSKGVETMTAISYTFKIDSVIIIDVYLLLR
jgi:hypothetical protein